MGERYIDERETHGLAAFLRHPNWGGEMSLKPMYMPLTRN